MFAETIFTLEEVSEHLRVPVEALQREIEAGRLDAMNIAGGLIRIRESSLNAFKSAAATAPSALAGSSNRQVLGPLQTAPDFTYIWPDKKRELYKEVRAGIASYRGREYHVKLGITTRHSAGSDRRRFLVLVDRYATVEFVSGEEDAQGRVAGIIRDRKGKQVPVGGTLPPEYSNLPVAPYRQVVVGPGASNGMAVICNSDDFETMVKHALIRYTFRLERA